jgi:inositol 1,4,5-triphosphate receptor type 1/inositol 1,4,5-triphosphate receptor type 3
LALSRNYLWKTYLEKIFTKEFVFDQIFDENSSIELRSAFCNLALTVYVDHEPFNPLIVPNLCRLIDKSKKTKCEPD